MPKRRVAVILAGGSGERFWPVSTRERPKQFLHLTDPERSLLREAAERAAAMVGWEATYVSTGRHLASQSQSECAALPPGNVLAEPTKRNTLGALVWAAASLIAKHPEDWAETTVAVLTADHRIAPEDAFHATLDQAMTLAEETGALVTIGIQPDRPETGYGYIEVGEPVAAGRWVRRFTEKPDAATAAGYVAGGQHLWNSGMFFWTLAAFMAELQQAEPDAATAAREIAACLASGDQAGAETAFEGLRGVSIDYALMEKAGRVAVVKADFDWDDLGAWDALSRSLPSDEGGNVGIGRRRVLESSGCVVYSNDPAVEVCVLGAEDLVVVVESGTVMVCPKSRAQEVRKFSQT